MPRPVVRTERREQIVRAALRLVRQHGVGGFTTAEVACEAGVSRGILHYHFTSKDEIIQEALRVLLVEFGRRAAAAVLAAGGPARTRLHALVEAATAERELAVYAALLEFWSPARREPAHRAAMGTLYDGWIASIAGIIRHDAERDPAAGSAEDLACALVALLDGLMVQRLIRRAWMPASRARRIAHAAVEAWFGAAGSRQWAVESV